MAASSADLLTQATVNSRPVPTTVTSLRTGGATTLAANALTGWPTATKVHFCTYKITTSGAKVAGSQIDFSGIVSGTNLTNLVVKAGTDSGNAVGDVIEAAPTAAYANDVYAWGITNHDSLGNHKDLTGSNSKTVMGITDGASTVNNLRTTAAITGADPQLAAEGTDSNVNLALKPKGTGVVKVDGSVPRSFFALYDFVESGLVWSGDAYGSTLNASMTAGFVWLSGQRVSVALITARAFTLSKDTYVDVDNTGTIFYTEVANNAASPALTSGRARVAIIISGATNIAAATSVNQGQETMVLPIASSIPYAVTDSLGNLICPRDPNRKILGYRQIVSSATTTSSAQVQVTGLSCPVIVPTGRKIKITAIAQVKNATSGIGWDWSLWDGVVASGTQLQDGGIDAPGANFRATSVAEIVITPSTASKTYNVGFSSGNNVATTTALAGSTDPAFIKVELV